MHLHPCFSERAHDRIGRVHLPVAPACNVRCTYCDRRICAHLSAQHPGWAREILHPRAALERVRALVDAVGAGHPFVVGVAGPGEPLANEETFETLDLVHREFPSLVLCVSSNGLLLRGCLSRLIEAGVRALTVTMSALDTQVGQAIYAWVRHDGVVYRGADAAELMVRSQLAGIEAALAAGLAVKVNSVLIPGLNEDHLPALARRLQEVGVPLMNIMPLIPAGLMRGRRAPTCEELRAVRARCERHVGQFRRCEHCRADVVAIPGANGRCRAAEAR
jgi:nitrogen fixation protein NifB